MVEAIRKYQFLSHRMSLFLSKMPSNFYLLLDLQSNFLLLTLVKSALDYLRTKPLGLFL